MPGKEETIIDLGKSANKGISLDLSTLIDTRLLIQSNSGGGKSFAIRRLLEQSHGQVQQIVLDLEGEFSTLREKYDYVICGKDGDAPATPQSAKLLARRLLELEVSAICDLYELKAHDRVRFVRLFLESLMNAPRQLWHPVLVVVDEAHHWCPEKGQAESSQAIIDLCTRGRKRGFCAVLATQRLSKLHKDSCAELLNKMIGRTSLDIDQSRAADELGLIGKKDRVNLRNLQPGEFHIYGPALNVDRQHSNDVIVFKVGSVKSRHPKIGERKLEAPPKPTDKIKAILGKLADLPEEARQEIEDLESLKKSNADLRRKLTIAERQHPSPKSCNHEPIIKDLQNKCAEYARKVNKANETIEILKNALEELPGVINKAFKAIMNNPIKYIPPEAVLPPPPPAPISKIEIKTENEPDNSDVLDSDITKPRQIILNVLASFERFGLDSMHKSSVAAFARVSPISGGYFNNLGKLRSLGYVDYPASSYVALTDAGRNIAKADIRIECLTDLHDAWLNILSRPKALIVRKLLDIYPQDISRDELAEQIGVSARSGGYFNNLGRLRTLGAIEYPSRGRVKASKLLFPEELK